MKVSKTKPISSLLRGVPESVSLTNGVTLDSGIRRNDGTVVRLKYTKIFLLVAVAALGASTQIDLSAFNPVSSAFAEEGHEEGEEYEEDGHEEASTVTLTPEQIMAAGIEVTELSLSNVASTFTAPGEVQLNDYRTVKITPRISAQITERHARLGENVEVGQPLVTLSSVEMAEAEGDLLVAEREWQRVKSLGRKVVSEKRYTEARVSRDQARARVHAFGMSDDEINKLLDNTGEITADGSFSLIATLSGRVLRDDFIIGERVDPGRVLMVIADESVMWVVARVRPDDVARIRPGNAASVLIGEKVHQATVSQIHHSLDETTRTLAVRVDVDNPDDSLHPGQFVNVLMQTNDTSKSLTVPEASVLRSPDGDWQVLVEQDHPGEFKAVEIELEYVSDGEAIISGIAEGTPVVTKGAFFVQSEMAKSGFDIHDH